MAKINSSPKKRKSSLPSEPETTSILSQKHINYTPLLMALLLVAAYLLGVLTTKINFMEKDAKTLGSSQPVTSPAPQQAAASITKDTIKGWAKDIGLAMDKFNTCFDANTYDNLITQDTQDGQTAQVDGTPTFFVNGKIIKGAVPYTEFQTSIDAALNHTDSAEAKTDVALGHLPFLGKKDAPVVIVEFSDFQCPFCNQFFKNTFSQLKKDYIDTGKVVLYYRQFPLTNIHPLAKPFANATECANEQNQFWAMHNKIFQEQE